jgi:hypothetical protein
MKIEVAPGTKAMIFFIVLICTSNFELHLCIFNGSCTFIFWAWIKYVTNKNSAQFTLWKRVKRCCGHVTLLIWASRGGEEQQGPGVILQQVLPVPAVYC